jgi:tetratricopeptide (TPR) repeat protein
MLAAAEREFKRAIEMNPDDPRPHEFYSWYLVPMGRHDQALAEAKRGQQLDPVSPETNLFLGSVLVFRHQYDQAMEQLRSGIELDPNYWFTRYFLGEPMSKKEGCRRPSQSFSARLSWRRTMLRIGQILDMPTRSRAKEPKRKRS